MKVDELLELWRLKVEAHADWRAQKAHEYLEDLRNERCAATGWRLLKSMKQLSPTDPSLFKFWMVSHLPGAEDCLEEQVSTEAYFLSRYGFDSEKSGDAGEFFEELAEVLRQEIVLAA